MASTSRLVTDGSALAAATGGIFSQRVYMFAAANCQAASYTVSTLLFVACIIKAPTAYRMNAVLTLMFLIATAHAICHLQFFREVIIEHGDDPKYAARLDTPYHVLNNLFMVLSAVIADALMIWRCYIFWDKRISAIILPSVMILTVCGSTVPWIIRIARDDGAGFISLGFAIFPVSVATNVVVTCLIAFRLIARFSTRPSPHVFQSPPLKLYRRVIGILVESAAMYAVTGVITVTTTTFGSPIEQVFVTFYAIMPSISAYLIVLRIRLGLAYDNSAFVDATSSIVFARKVTITPSRVPSTPRSKPTAVHLGALDSIPELCTSSNSIHLITSNYHLKAEDNIDVKAPV